MMISQKYRFLGKTRLGSARVRTQVGMIAIPKPYHWAWCGPCLYLQVIQFQKYKIRACRLQQTPHIENIQVHIACKAPICI